MDRKIISDVMKQLESSLPTYADDRILFAGDGYKSIPITEKNFHEFPSKAASSKKIAFVDGGNMELLSSPAFSLQFIRVYACIYHGSKRVDKLKFESYVLITSHSRENKIHYKASVFDTGERFMPGHGLEFDSHEVFSKRSVLRVHIGEVGNAVRRFSEIELARMLIEKGMLSRDDALVLDGNLKCGYSHETGFFSGLYGSAEQKGVVISGLAKTSRLLTDNANSVVALLGGMKEGAWVYYPVADITADEHMAEMFFVRFHDSSDYVFRFELYKPMKDRIWDVMPLLKENSDDAAFIGYPYGLIDADRFARVSRQEADRLRLYLLLTAKDKRLKGYFNAVNAHSVLDSIG